MRFIVATLIGTLPLLAAKGLSANHLSCVKAAQRPQGLGLDTYRFNTLAVCGATPALTVCTAWTTWAISARSGDVFREIYKPNRPVAGIDTARAAIECIADSSSS
jgi:hypothetical protein